MKGSHDREHCPVTRTITIGIIAGITRTILSWIISQLGC